MSNKLTTEEFIKKAKAIHGERYNYSKSVYLTKKLDLEIICLTHGSFFLKPQEHLYRKRHCPLCGKIRNSVYSRKRNNTSDFIKRAKEFHGNKYDYSKVKYKNTTEKIEIICAEHGSFFQSPNNHMSKYNKNGCPKCSGCVKLTTQEFVEKANIIHNNKYDYSKVEYKNWETKVQIYCSKKYTGHSSKKDNEHGYFWQSPNKHLSPKRGCPKCSINISKPEILWLNFLNIPDDSQHRQVRLTINNKLYRVDGFDPITNTIYEFLGDYWHGNINRFPGNMLNSHCKKTMKQLNEETIDKFFQLGNAGYNIEFIWESEFLRGNNVKDL